MSTAIVVTSVAYIIMGVTSLLTKFERMRLYRAPFFPIRIFLLFEVKALCFLSSPLPTLRSFCFDTGTHWGGAGRKGGGRSDGCATYMDVRQAIWYIWALAISRGGEGESEDFYMKVVKKGVGAAHFPTAAKAPDSRSFLRLFLSAPIPSFYALPPTLICTTIRPQRPLGPFLRRVPSFGYGLHLYALVGCPTLRASSPAVIAFFHLLASPLSSLLSTSGNFCVSADAAAGRKGEGRPQAPNTLHC